MFFYYFVFRVNWFQSFMFQSFMFISRWSMTVGSKSGVERLTI
jgi:hypothetical protein